ncbi:MAG: phytanoyl-CoA dioxygenase family protein [Verrucomicrobiae bacterium]|nr:phytanoyl-CoA dioxygenase family protein [Verrucomicrobiae bacterium]
MPRAVREAALNLAAFRDHGYRLVPSIFDAGEVSRMRVEADRVSADEGTACVRNLSHRSSLFRGIADGERLAGLIGAVLRPVRGILFDKTAGENWSVSWHQDLTVAVESRVDVPGYGPWSVKDGVVHAHAPAYLLERMVTFRIHLDDTPAENGALRVIPGSHRHGRLGDAALEELTRRPEVTCAASAGDVLLISPLILHASRRVTRPARRRVVHFEYAPPDALDPRLSWAEGPTSLTSPVRAGSG